MLTVPIDTTLPPTEPVVPAWRRRGPGTHTVPGEGSPRPDSTDVRREEEPG